tara:strand:+ start:208 stop:351 length:144 start_codon:yes stop_codon:yes gene_type:complete
MYKAAAFKAALLKRQNPPRWAGSVVGYKLVNFYQAPVNFYQAPVKFV